MKLDHSKPNPFDKNYEEIELEDEETGLTTGEMVLESTTLPFTTKHQLCTDFPFLVLFSAFLIILSILYASIHSSRWSTQPKSLLYPTDFLGRSCGSINKQQYALAKKSDTLESVNTLSVPYFGACKESVYSLQCQTEVLRYFRSFTNEVEFYDLRTKPYLYYLDTQDPGKYGGICVSYCPGTKENENYCPPELKQYNGTNACSFERPDGTLFVEAAESMQFRTILNRCIPTTASLKAAHFAPSARVIDKYAAMMPEVFSESIAHVVRQWKIVLLSLVTALLLAFVFLIVIRLFARLFIWLIVFSVMIGMVIGVVFAAGEALQWRQKYFPTAIAEAQFYRYSTSFSAQTYGVIAVALGSCLIMYTLFVYVYYSNIQRSVGIMREAARAVSSVPQLMLFCVGMFFILLVFYMQWFLFSVNLWSIGSTTVVGENTVFNFSKYMRYASAIHLFGFFWLSQFITAYSITTTAGVVCEWYFTPKSKRPLLFLTMPVIRSAVSVTIYSLGSIAFGSLVVGIVKFISFVLKRVIQRLQSSVKKYRALNIIVGCFACIVRIFLAILNKIVNTITKHAYIQVAIYGTDFIESSRNAISLLTNNAAQVLVLDWVVDWILFCGKICIASATCYSSYLLSFVVPSSSGHIEGTSNFSLVLLALIFFCSYRIASLFLSLYDTATDTIIHCYLIDEQLCNANPSRAMSCSSELLGLMVFEREKNQDSIKMNGEY